MNKIDINCDAGEGFGNWEMGNDAELINFVTSVNIACGFHAGDPTTMHKTASLALQKGVKIGAHPSYPDLQGFGRRAMSLSPLEVYDCCVYQIGAMKVTVEALGGELHHVKPHGALYNAAAQDIKLAEAIAMAVKNVDDKLILYGLSGSFLISEAEEIGLVTASEAFADRTYQRDGSLTPRNNKNALVKSVEEAKKQVIQMIEKQTVTSITGEEIPLKVDTICIHGDGENAVSFAKAIWELIYNKQVS